ncbi:MAG: cytochrome c [Granulosicoccus sp.]|nr:cytochrome c [Granulosicoccus sp.]
MFTHNRIRSAILGLGVMLIISQAIAHTGASGIVKERMDAMGVLGDHAKTVGDMLKGKTPFNVEAVELAASAFIKHGEQIPMLFPDTEVSRTGSKTEALPAIWTEWDDFVALATRFTEDSRALADIVTELNASEQTDEEKSRAVRTAFFRAAKSCSGCHEQFRLKQD